MSTRGFLSIIDEQKNIQMAAFSPSDSYPSGLGLRVLDAIQRCEFPQLINELHREYPDEIDTVRGIERSWYIRTSANKDDYFYDYAFELDGAKQELTMYHYGDKALKIPYEQIPLFQFVFEKENELYYPLCLDERTMSLKKDFYKEIRSMVKEGATVEDFQRIIDQNPSVLYLDYGRVKDTWALHTESFNKYVRDSAGGSLMFHVDESFGQFRIYVQTPFVRAPIPHKPIRSAGAAEKVLAELVRDRPDDIRGTMKLFPELTAYSQAIRTIYDDDTRSLEDRAESANALKQETLTKYNRARSQYQIFGNTDRLLEREINEVCHRNYRHARDRLEEQQKKSALSETLQDATQRAASESTSTPEQTHAALGR